MNTINITIPREGAILNLTVEQEVVTPKLGDRRINKDGIPEIYMKAGSDIIVTPKPRRTVAVKAAAKPAEPANLSIHVPTGEKGDTEYVVHIKSVECKGEFLRQTILNVIEQLGNNWNDCLTLQELKMVEGIIGVVDTRLE